MKTGERVRHLGLYDSSCCIEEVVFDTDDRLTRCPKCERFCGWDLVERVFSWQELEHLEKKAA